ARKSPVEASRAKPLQFVIARLGVHIVFVAEAQAQSQAGADLNVVLDKRMVICPCELGISRTDSPVGILGNAEQEIGNIGARSSCAGPLPELGGKVSRKAVRRPKPGVFGKLPGPHIADVSADLESVLAPDQRQDIVILK